MRTVTVIRWRSPSQSTMFTLIEKEVVSPDSLRALITTWPLCSSLGVPMMMPEDGSIDMPVGSAGATENCMYLSLLGYTSASSMSL